MTENEDFLFAQEALAQGFVTEAQVEEGFLLQKRMSEDLQLDERLAVILVKRGYLAEDQARRVHARIQPQTGPGEIQGYRLLDVVGRGAMGTVYRAVHLGLNREVAVKVLRADLAGDRTQIERLKAEAAMLASLDHPNIVRALDAGESNGFPYVVMEYVEGESLRDRLRREGSLKEAEALRIARALADALERARRMGVVHRDVKPGNVLLTRAGVPKLMDLGLAKGPIDLGLTQHGATVGTPQYIAPEQALDPRKADTRSDIYGLGATLYSMLTGVPPFDGQTLAEVLTKVLYEAPVPVRTLRPEVSAETGYLVERMMLRDPSLRYRTPAQVVADIDRLTQGASILPQGFRGNWEGYLLRRRIRRTSLVATSAVLCALLVAGGVKVVQDWRRRSRAEDDVSARLAATRTEVSPLESRADLASRLALAEDLFEDARRVGSPRAEGVGIHVKDLREHLRRYDVLTVTLRDRVDPALARGDFAAADAALRDYAALFPVWGPARRAAEARTREVLEGSDDAMRAERRERAVPASPASLAELREATARWRTRLSTVYAATPAHREELSHALDAAEASRRISAAADDALRALDEGWLASGLADLRLAGLARDLAAAREAASGVLREEGHALTAPDRRFLSAERLEALVAAPFDARWREVEARVRAAWTQAQATARDAAAADDVPGAVALLARWARAAGEEGAFPDVAGAAVAAEEDLASGSRRRLEAGRAALAALVREAVADVRRGDLDALEARVREARRAPDVFRPVLQGLDEVTRLAPARRSVRADALAGLAARVGEDRSLWIETLRLRGDAAPERQVELVEVRPADGTFVFRTHKGNAVQGPFTRSVDEVADEDLLRLAGVAEGGPQARFVRAAQALATRPIDATDYYEAIAALREVEEGFEAAAPGSALAAWAREARLAAEADAARNETFAQRHFDAAREAMASRRYGEAFHWFRTLTDPAEEPSLRLPSSKVARQWATHVEAQMARIRTQFNVEALEIVWPGVRVVRRPGGSPDALDVDLVFDFDRPVQGEVFRSGWGRFVPAGQGRAILTPASQASGMSFRLNDAGEGEVVRDRPLVLETPFDPAFETSVSFWIWPETPVFLAIDLDGAQVGVLSADPRTYPFPPDVPLLEGERVAPLFDVYGRGRGVLFRTGTDFGDPERWGWDDGNQGRHFVPPEVDRPKRREQLDRRWFAFEIRERPYKVRFVRVPEKGVRLEVDDREVASDSSPALRSPRSSGRIQILTYTPCVIDDLVVSGRVDPAWLEKQKALRMGKPGAPRGVMDPGR